MSQTQAKRQRSTGAAGKAGKVRRKAAAANVVDHVPGELDGCVGSSSKAAAAANLFDHVPDNEHTFTCAACLMHHSESPATMWCMVDGGLLCKPCVKKCIKSGNKNPITNEPFDKVTFGGVSTVAIAGLERSMATTEIKCPCGESKFATGHNIKNMRKHAMECETYFETVQGEAKRGDSSGLKIMFDYCVKQATQDNRLIKGMEVALERQVGTEHTLRKDKEREKQRHDRKCGQLKVELKEMTRKYRELDSVVSKFHCMVSDVSSTHTPTRPSMAAAHRSRRLETMERRPAPVAPINFDTPRDDDDTFGFESVIEEFPLFGGSPLRSEASSRVESGNGSNGTDIEIDLRPRLTMTSYMQ